MLQHEHAHRRSLRVWRVDVSRRVGARRAGLRRRQQGGRRHGRREVVEADARDGEVHQDVSGVTDAFV